MFICCCFPAEFEIVALAKLGVVDFLDTTGFTAVLEESGDPIDAGIDRFKVDCGIMGALETVWDCLIVDPSLLLGVGLAIKLLLLPNVDLRVVLGGFKAEFLFPEPLVLLLTSFAVPFNCFAVDDAVTRLLESAFKFISKRAGDEQRSLWRLLSGELGLFDIPTIFRQIDDVKNIYYLSGR